MATETQNAHVHPVFAGILNSFAAKPLFQKRTPFTSISIDHYKRHAAGEAFSILGCGCRGCQIWHKKEMAKYGTREAEDRS